MTRIFIEFRKNSPNLRFTALARGASGGVSVRVKPCCKIKKMSSNLGIAMAKK
jgi:hypothetical protein